MSLTSKQKHELKKFLKELGNYKGRHTELVTVYIPQGYDINKVINHISQEQGTATNIKSTSTRKNVLDALERMIQHLRLFKRTPENGLAAFSGNVAEREGQSDVKIWSIEPPVPLKTRIYRCDKTFQLDLLQDMVDTKEVYGLVVLDRRDAQLALLKGKTIVPLQKTHSEVPGKMRAGGQCLLQNTKVLIDKNTAIPINEFQLGNKLITYDFKNNILKNTSCLDYWRKTVDKLYLIKTNNSEVKCSRNHVFFVKKQGKVLEIPAKDLMMGDILFFVKDMAVEEAKIENISIENGKFELVDISVKNQNFIANGIIVHNSAQRFERLRDGAIKDHYKKIAEHMKNQFLHLKELKGIIIGGPGVTVDDFMNKDYLTGDLKKKILGTKDLSYTDEFGLQELLDKSGDILAKEEVAEEKKIMQKFFHILSTRQCMVSYGKEAVMQNVKNGVVDVLLLSEDLDDDIIEEFEKEAEALGSDVKIISTETREGVQLRDMGKVAAILRYEVYS